MDKKTRTYEFFVSIFIFITTIFFLFISIQNPVKAPGKGIGPMEFPIVIFSIMFLLVAVVIIKNICNRQAGNLTLQESTGKTEKKDLRLPLTMFLIVSYALTWKVVGFTLSTFFYIALQAKVLNRKSSNKMCILISVLAVAFVHLIFNVLFSIDFPEPLLTLVLER